MLTLSGPTLTLKDAAATFPGSPVCYETIRRWATRGIKGVKLETARIGGRRMTTVEACREFVERLTEVDNPEPEPVTEKERMKLAREARDRMKIKHGI